MSMKNHKSDPLKKKKTKKNSSDISSRKIKSDNTNKSDMKIKPFLKKVLDEKILEEKITRMQHELDIIKNDKKDKELKGVLEEINLLKYQSSIEIIINTLSEYIFSDKAKLSIFDKRSNSKIPHKTLDGQILNLEYIDQVVFPPVKLIFNALAILSIISKLGNLFIFKIFNKLLSFTLFDNSSKLNEETFK